MIKVIFVKKNGTLKNSSIKLDNLNNLYKKCLFSSGNNFESRNIWSLDNDSFYTIYSKNKGKAGSENKYELPPPIDSELYFGKMIFDEFFVNRDWPIASALAMSGILFLAIPIMVFQLAYQKYVLKNE